MGTSLNEDSDVYYKFSSSKLISNTKDNANYFTFSIKHESFDGSLTEKQFNSTVKVMKDIDKDHIIGHNEVNPIVKPKCPGNKFPFDRIIQALKH